MRKFLPLILILVTFNRNVMAQCNAAFTSSVNQATAQFHTSNTAAHLLHSWRFGDNTTGFGANVSHTYSSPGTYMVLHIVTDSLNTCSDSAQQSVVINFPVSCTAAFTAVRDSLLLNQYHFYSTSVISGGSLQSYNWTINGSTVSTASSFNYSFTAGTYTVCLVITTTAGCTSSTCQTLTIAATNSCNWHASFTTTASASNPRQISFLPSPSQNTMRYLWNFDTRYPSLTSTAQNPVYTYSQAGTYSVKLTIMDTLTGCYDTVRQFVQVHGLPSDSCTASFSYIINLSIQNQVLFTANSNQTIVSQTWNITALDSSHHATVTTMNPTYTFPDTGYYSVCLRIQTITGCIRSYCNVVHITHMGQRVANLITAFPNPVNGATVDLQVIAAQQCRIRIAIYDASGIAISVTDRPGVQGSNRISLPVGGLQPGQYFVDIQYGNERKRSIFQKL